jgi:hypothetical protein
LPQDPKHSVNVVGCEAPIASDAEIPDTERFGYFTEAKSVHVVYHLARQELRSASGRLVVEEDAASESEPIGLPIASTEQMRGGLGCGVGALWVKGRALIMDDRLSGNRTEHLSARSLIYARPRAVVANSIE